MALILKNISSKPLCAFFETTCSQVQMELHRRQFRVLWHEDKVKTKKLFLISAAQRKLKQQDNLGGWAGGRFPSLSQAVAYPSFWQSFLRKWKIVFHQHGHGTVILCLWGMPAHQVCWVGGVFFFLISPLLVEMPDLDLWSLQGAGHHCVFALKALLQGCQVTVCFFLPLPAEYSEK